MLELHTRLDESVFAAYGCKSDLSDDEILEKLLALNLERGKLVAGNTYYPPVSCLPQVAEIKTPRPVDAAEGGFAVE